MSYSIQYGPAEPGKKGKKRSYFGVIGAVLVLLVCAAAVGWSIPETLRQALFPWTQSAVREAFAEFEEDVSRGEPFGDALTDFCLEIINDANPQK